MRNEGKPDHSNNEVKRWDSATPPSTVGSGMKLCGENKTALMVKGWHAKVSFPSNERSLMKLMKFVIGPVLLSVSKSNLKRGVNSK